jgi:protein SCO1/2
MRRVYRLVMFFLCGAVLSACKPEADPVAGVLGTESPAPGRLSPYWELPEFDLLDQTGAAFKRSSMKGKVWVVDFFYTSCPGPCPALTSRLSELHQRFSADPRVGFLSVSSDPLRDTPQVLRVYAEKFRADERWVFLTGSKDAVYDLANKGFRLSLKEVADPVDPISHSTRLCLVDSMGWVRGFYEGVGEESSPASKQLEEDAKVLVSEMVSLKP